jgi:hypothetical protein
VVALWYQTEGACYIQKRFASVEGKRMKSTIFSLPPCRWWLCRMKPSGASHAQPLVLVGWTAQQESSLTPYLAAMRAGFSGSGYVEGRNLMIDYRYGNDAVRAYTWSSQPNW